MAKKRGYGEGSVRKLPSGSWRAQVMIGYRDDGKRNIKSFVAPTRSEALDKLHSFVDANAEKGQPDEQQTPSIVPFKSFAQQWYESYKGQVEASTYAGYYYTLQMLIKQFGDTPLDQLKTTSINNFINKLMQTGYSPSTIRKCRAMLIQICDAAEADDLIVKNYARRALTAHKKRTLAGEDEVAKDSFSPEEFQILMQDLPENLIGYSIRLMLVSGLRLQELIALSPQDIAEDGSSVSVTKAVKIVDGHPIMGVTKSRSSVRQIPIPDKYRYITLWLRTNGGQVYLWCSPKRDNLLYDTGSVRRRYYRAIEKIPGVRRLSPHCCRHSYVTLLQSQGVPLETISKLTGHSDIETTGHYLHISEDTLRNAVSSLENI